MTACLERHGRSFLFAVGNRPCNLKGHKNCSANQGKQLNNFTQRHTPFRFRVRGSKKIFVSTGAWPEERDHLHLQTVPAAISDGSFRISQLLTKYNSVFLVRLLPALQKGSAVVFFFQSLWYTIVYFDLSFEKEVRCNESTYRTQPERRRPAGAGLEPVRRRPGHP